MQLRLAYRYGGTARAFDRPEVRVYTSTPYLESTRVRDFGGDRVSLAIDRRLPYAARYRSRAGFAEATGRTENKSPPTLANVFRHSAKSRMNEEKGRCHGWDPAKGKRYRRGP